MTKAIKLGSDQGHRGRLRGVYINDERFHPFLVEVTLIGDKDLGIHTATFTSQASSFRSVLIARANQRWRGGLGNAPLGPNYTDTKIVTRPFNLGLSDVRILAEAETLSVQLVGRLQSRTFVLREKEVARLREWFSNRLAQVEASSP